ncbi:hypothetical protein CEXT_813231 [Caerostris extrusa]|uniref:Uncharacterized protein n=1 Tax=Caerostris extrusa TaxID=172846 RepID=A0AAV4TK12_CAEEX|nr:hypothetical protein CEXT_813231 [Caerostris extrusa]
MILCVSRQFWVAFTSVLFNILYSLLPTNNAFSVVDDMFKPFMDSDISVNILSTSFEIKSVAIHPLPEDDASTSSFDRQREIATTKAKESNQGTK